MISATTTSVGSFSTPVKKIFKSNATARSVFGRALPATNSRYRSSSGWPSE